MRTHRARRVRRGPVVTLAVTAIGTATIAAAAPPDRQAVPDGPPLSAATLGARESAAHQEIVRALGAARRDHDGDRTAALRGLLRPGRRYLSFDPRGDGRVVEVYGDLARARRIAVVVPGADGKLTNFDSWKFAGGGAHALYRAARAYEPRTATVAWLGYEAPGSISPGVLTSGRAVEGARDLRRFVAGLHGVNGRAGISLLCHSYGTVVCGKAAPRLPVSDIALYGSPGTTARGAAGLKSPGRVWAGRAGGDWMRFVPKVDVLGLGFGRDPVAKGFGARRFAAGDGKHSEYLRPGSESLHSLALIAAGRGAEVPHA